MRAQRTTCACLRGSEAPRGASQRPLGVPLVLEAEAHVSRSGAFLGRSWALHSLVALLRACASLSMHLPSACCRSACMARNCHGTWLSRTNGTG